ncbi:MAG TPA: cyanophycin synthetase [Thermoanaerobaculia bacterium]|jgi:cyanophycin synthetase|nr:cyanophycin synthetase [Thermoanaerobaculia bacterium]
MLEDNRYRIQVIERLALMGPKLYAQFPCIKWKVDIGPFEERPTNTIDGFHDTLKATLPSLVEHRCSEGRRGGFLSRVQDGTWLGHVMEHCAIELQNLAGIAVGFGRARSADGPGIYNVIYECEERSTGLMAGELAIELIESLIAGEPFPVEEHVHALRRKYERNSLGPSTKAIVDAAVKRRIPFMRLDELNLVQLGYGANSKKIQATIASTTRFLGVDIAGDKDKTKAILGFHGVPVPGGDVTRHCDEGLEIANRIGWPVVVKPLDASQGRGIVTNIRNEEEFRLAFDEAKRHRQLIVVERYLPGRDFRLLCINQKFVAAAERVPAHVIGDGEHTIGQLLDVVNQDPRRGEGHEKVLTRIKIDAATLRLLELRGLSVDSVPPPGEFIQLKTTANLSTGGTSIDVTDRVHPANIELAERIACLIGLDIAGIDVVAPSVETPVVENGGGIVEVNAAPGFRMHLAPTEGKPRPVGEAVVDMLFPPGCEARIPIITITGTNGKTTTARLCAHIAKMAGKNVGLTTSDGIYIRNQLVQKGDTTGPLSAQVVLRDPSVNFAVLETARGGIIRAGVAYDWSNAAIVTNISEDHLGLRDVHTLEDLARVKAVTVERVKPDGYAILNAEDDMTPVILEQANCKLAYFSLDPNHQRFREHIAADGVGATLENGWLMLYENGIRIALTEVRNVPITFGGKARFNIANALAAVLATFATNIAVTDIVSGLQSFFQSPTTTPGRINIIDFDGFRVMIDYAHNPHGLAAVSELAEGLRRNRLICVLGLPGDRRNEDIRAAAQVVGRHFDRVIVRDDFDLRGRKAGEVAAIIREGLMAGGLRESQIVERREEAEAIALAVTEAQPGDLVLYVADKPEIAARYVEDLRQVTRARETETVSAGR